MTNAHHNVRIQLIEVTNPSKIVLTRGYKTVINCFNRGYEAVKNRINRRAGLTVSSFVIERICYGVIMEAYRRRIPELVEN